jgi:hypothetical protein
VENDMNNELEFFVMAMPHSRPADYCLGYFEGSVYIDFDNYGNERICLKRISFDRYGCCTLEDKVIPMNEIDSRDFKAIIGTQLSDQSRLLTIVKKTIKENRDLIWEDALEEYSLI